MPTGQATHSVDPAWLLYLPTAHRTQVPPLGPDEPALHVQLSAESLPDGEFAWVGQLEHVDDELVEYLPATHVVHVDAELAADLPSEQAIHSAAPVWLLYLPAIHCTQVPPLGPDEPALHVQSSAESLPDGEFA